MKYKIEIKTINSKEGEKYPQEDTIYGQVKEGEIDLMAVINAFNKEKI